MKIVLAPPSGNSSVLLHGDSLFVLGGGLNMVGRLWWALLIVALSITHVSVSVANNFIHPPTAADQGYHAFGELARFIYCLLQKIKTASSLPLVEQWEEYVVANHSRFAPIDDKHFLEGTRVMAALGNICKRSSVATHVDFWKTFLIVCFPALPHAQSSDRG